MVQTNAMCDVRREIVRYETQDGVAYLTSHIAYLLFHHLPCYRAVFGLYSEEIDAGGDAGNVES